MPLDVFEDYVADTLAGLSAVCAVALGGSRAALRESAARTWRHTAKLTLDYARSAYAERSCPTETVGALGQAACAAAHAVLAKRGEWITNEKRLLERAGLRGVDQALAGLSADPESLTGAVDAVIALIRPDL